LIISDKAVPQKGIEQNQFCQILFFGCRKKEKEKPSKTKGQN